MTRLPMHEARRRPVQRNPRNPAYCETGHNPISGEHLVYAAILWGFGQTFFSFQANGSMLNGPDGKPVGSLLIAQPFTQDEYFWPRPSAASYDGSASASSA